MWGVVAEAATMLDSPDCDWRTLQQIEEMLSSVSAELDRVAAAEPAGALNGSRAPRADPDARFLRASLAWVRQHEYVALESELQKQLDTARRCALGTLDRVVREPSRRVTPPVDG
jgi:hypothetical protein